MARRTSRAGFAERVQARAGGRRRREQFAARLTPDARADREGRLAFLFSGLALTANLGSGILVARTLGTSGRGAIAAITALPQLVGWLAAVGCVQAVSFHQARRPADGARLIATWLVLLIPLAVAGVLVGELVLPSALAAQTDATYELARLFMLTLIFLLLGELAYGVLLGDQDFRVFNVMRVASPAAIAAGYATAWAFGLLTVATALLVLVSVGAVSTVFVLGRVVRRHGIGRPSLSLGKRTLWFGARAHGANVGGLANARLDVLMIAAFLSASSVGLYSVATNVSWIVVSVAGARAALAGPAAARQGGARGARTVIRSLHGTLAVGLGLAVAIATFAPLAVELIYGPAFAPSVAPLRLLLPGCVLYAASGVLCSGLYACDRPLSAALTQAAGVAVTVAGLALFLEPGGIVAASIVSTVSYATVFAAALVVYKRAAGLSWAAFAPSIRELAIRWSRASRPGPEAT